MVKKIVSSSLKKTDFFCIFFAILFNSFMFYNFIKQQQQHSNFILGHTNLKLDGICQCCCLIFVYLFSIICFGIILQCIFFFLFIQFYDGVPLLLRYCSYYEFIILLTSCMCNILLQVPFKMISISNTAKCIQNISSDKE